MPVLRVMDIPWFLLSEASFGRNLFIVIVIYVCLRLAGELKNDDDI